jgi:hypothetical protein
MSKFFPARTQRVSRSGLPSALYLIEWAGLLVVLFVIAQFAGLREFTSVLNGTVGSTSLDWQTASILGVVYVLIYLGMVLVVPILILAALLLKIWQRVVAAKVVTQSGVKTLLDPELA